MKMTMTTEEFEAGCKALVKNRGHGWMSDAAKALGVSRKTITRAVNDQPTASISGKLTAALEAAPICDWVEGAMPDAGAWAVGEPEGGRREEAILGEAVVTHLHTPMMLMHVTLRRGKDELGQQKVTIATRWIDEPSSDARRRDLVERAEARGRAFATKVVAAHAERERRERLLAAAQKASGMDRGELDLLSDAQLISAKSTATPAELHAAKKSVKDAIQASHDEMREKSPEVRLAFREGVDTGKRIQMLVMQETAEIHADADIAALIWARYVAQTGMAAASTRRGGREGK
ncbi:hypothetical protein [Sulfitobacter sp. W074]|uniref:hypothetical protein n=1 Tax=Sulfitobacter sp. W074 TaxID=2867026 RepID=UPI0021A8BC06|nr:hypothetical protein [Sulfitobacter sp. W074]UWR38375.1 hypothetical protein K3762_04910 [Sulfitobacter sp. W074]